MSSEIHALLEAAADGPTTSLDLGTAWNRGRRRRRSQRLVLVAALAVFVIVVATLVGVGWSSSDSIGPAVDVPDSVTPIPGFDVSVDLPNGDQLPNGTVDSPDWLLRLAPTARNTTDHIVTDPNCVLDRYTVWISPAGHHDSPWILPILEQDRIDGTCTGPQDIEPGMTAPRTYGGRFVTAGTADGGQLAPGVYLIEIRFDDGGSAYAPITVNTNPPNDTTVVPDQVMVPGADASGLMVETYPELPIYHVAFDGPSGQALLLSSQKATLDTLLPDYQAILEAAPSANLPNGVTVKLYCGGLTNAPDGTQAPAGSITAGWFSGDRFYTLTALPDTTADCTPPQAAEGPLIDAVETLRSVDRAELDQLALRFPPPAK